MQTLLITFTSRCARAFDELKHPNYYRELSRNTTLSTVNLMVCCDSHEQYLHLFFLLGLHKITPIDYKFIPNDSL